LPSMLPAPPPSGVAGRAGAAVILTYFAKDAARVLIKEK
jgi:hypothetical protein